MHSSELVSKLFNTYTSLSGKRNESNCENAYIKQKLILGKTLFSQWTNYCELTYFKHGCFSEFQFSSSSSNFNLVIQLK